MQSAALDLDLWDLFEEGAQGQLWGLSWGERMRLSVRGQSPGGTSVEGFHGTSLSCLASILRNGFVNSKADHRPAGVYVTPCLDLAFGSYSNPSDPFRIVVVVRVPDPSVSDKRLWCKKETRNKQWFYYASCVTTVGVEFLCNAQTGEPKPKLPQRLMRTESFRFCKNPACAAKMRKARYNEHCCYSCQEESGIPEVPPFVVCCNPSCAIIWKKARYGKWCADCTRARCGRTDAARK